MNSYNSTSVFSALAQLAPRGFLKTGLLAVALGVAFLLSGAAPSLTLAQEPLQISPQYYQDLEAYLSSPEARVDASVSVSPEELGLDLKGEGSTSAPVPRALFSSPLSLQSTGTQTSVYDFAIDLVSINGNIPTVPGCDRNPLGVPRSFFDNFDDGLLEEGCTSQFHKFGTFIESGGLLRMLSEHGFSGAGIIQHILAYKTTFKDGQGNFFAVAGFRPDAPAPPPLFSTYSLTFFDAGVPPSPLPRVMIRMAAASDGRPVIVASKPDGSGGSVFRSAPVDLTGKPSVLFGVSFDDATNAAVPFYSLDFGQTIFVWRNPDGTLFTAPLFTESGMVGFHVAAGVKEPIWDVPLYTQRESDFPSRDETKRWAGETYANGRGMLGDDPCGFRIEQCGCAITSAVMMARFYGVTMAQGKDVQPFNLDTWLNGNNGYNGTGGFYWSALDRYTEFRTRFSVYDDTANNFALLGQHLNSGEPSIAKANAARGNSVSHFFVINGKRADGSYSVRDPFWYNTQNLTEGVTSDVLALRDYESGFDGLRIYKKGDGIASSNLSISVASPAELLLIDPLGRRVGKDPITGATYDEIPGAGYFADAIGDPTGAGSPTGHVSKTVYLSEPAEGDYALQVIGTDVGSYALTVNAVNDEGVLNETQTTGVTDTGISSSFETSFSATASEPPPLIKEVSFGSIRRDIEIALQLGIVDNPGIAKSLLQKLNAAEMNEQEGKSQTARNILNALKQEVGAQKGKHVSGPFASVLIQDIDALSRSLSSSALSLSLLLANLYTLLSQLLTLLGRL